MRDGQALWSRKGDGQYQQSFIRQPRSSKGATSETKREPIHKTTRDAATGSVWISCSQKNKAIKEREIRRYVQKEKYYPSDFCRYGGRSTTSEIRTRARLHFRGRERTAISTRREVRGTTSFVGLEERQLER